MIKWFKAGLSFVLFCVVVIVALPKLFPALDPLIKSFFSPFLPEESFVTEMTVREENREFRRQLSQKTFDENELLRLKEENSELRRQLKLKNINFYTTEVLPIYQRHPKTWNYEFSVKTTGSRAVKQNYGVMIGGYLIGKARRENKESLRIKTFLSSEEEFAVNIKGTPWNGLLRGEYQNESKKSGRLLCLVDYLPRDAEIKEGMLLQSTGTLGIPKGLQIARVVRTERDEVVQRAYVELLAPLTEAGYVSLIVDAEK